MTIYQRSNGIWHQTDSGMRQIRTDIITFCEIATLNLSLLKCFSVLKILRAAPTSIEILTNAHRNKRFLQVIRLAATCEHPVKKIPILKVEKVGTVVTSLHNFRLFKRHGRMTEGISPFGIRTYSIDALGKVRGRNRFIGRCDEFDNIASDHIEPAINSGKLFLHTIRTSYIISVHACNNFVRASKHALAQCIPKSMVFFIRNKIEQSRMQGVIILEHIFKLMRKRTILDHDDLSRRNRLIQHAV